MMKDCQLHYKHLTLMDMDRILGTYVLLICSPPQISLFSVWPITRTYFSLNIFVKFESSMNDIPPPRSYYTMLQWQLVLFSQCGASHFEEHHCNGTGFFEHWPKNIRMPICMSLYCGSHLSLPYCMSNKKNFNLYSRTDIPKFRWGLRRCW